MNAQFCFMHQNKYFADEHLPKKWENLPLLHRIISCICGMGFAEESRKKPNKMCDQESAFHLWFANLSPKLQINCGKEKKPVCTFYSFFFLDNIYSVFILLIDLFFIECQKQRVLHCVDILTGAVLSKIDIAMEKLFPIIFIVKQKEKTISFFFVKTNSLHLFHVQLPVKFTNKTTSDYCCLNTLRSYLLFLPGTMVTMVIDLFDVFIFLFLFRRFFKEEERRIQRNAA